MKIAVAHVDKAAPFDAYAFEIAHHVHAKMLKVDTEGPENLVVVVPRGTAERLVQGKDIETRQGVLLENEVCLNGEPLTLWLSGDEAPLDVKDRYLPCCFQSCKYDRFSENRLLDPYCHVLFLARSRVRACVRGRLVPAVA